MRTPKKIYKRTWEHFTTYYIECEDGYSPLAISVSWPIQDHQGLCGYVDHLPGHVWETSWLDLLIITGISKNRINEALEKNMDTNQCQVLFWDTAECP
jgi:hypothetical protein